MRRKDTPSAEDAGWPDSSTSAAAVAGTYTTAVVLVGMAVSSVKPPGYWCQALAISPWIERRLPLSLVSRLPGGG